jgi:hypothetical protein
MRLWARALAVAAWLLAACAAAAAESPSPVDHQFVVVTFDINQCRPSERAGSTRRR